MCVYAYIYRACVRMHIYCTNIDRVPLRFVLQIYRDVLAHRLITKTYDNRIFNINTPFISRMFNIQYREPTQWRFKISYTLH